MMVTQPPTIFLGSKPSTKKDTRGFFEKALDITSSILLEPTTFFRSPSQAGKIVAGRRADVRSGVKGSATAIVAETLTATAIASGLLLGGATAGGRAVAGQILAKAAPTTVPKIITGATVGGILLTSKKARNVAGTFVDDPTKLGREAGAILEKAVAGKDVGTLSGALKTAGVAGLAIAGGAAVVGAVKKLKTAPKEIGKSPSDAVVPTSKAIPSNTVPLSTDLSPVEVISPTESEAKTPGVVVNNVINNIPKGL